MTSGSIRIFKYITGVTCFVIGVIIYLLWREGLLIHRVITWLGLDLITNPLRSFASDLYLPEWIRFSLPDGLWVTSYILIMSAQDIPHKILWISIIPLVGFISELLQIVHFMPGTFDFIDLFFYIIPLIIYICYEFFTKNFINKH